MDQSASTGGMAEDNARLSMPAEWVPHELTLVAWPQREDAWRGTTIEAARDTHAEVVAAISQFEPVLLVADPSQAADARSRVPAENVEVLELPIDDSWLRDSGPIILSDGQGRRVGVDFRFNAWGEAFPLTVDWIYPHLSAQDKATIRTVFLRWADENLNASVSGGDHPQPVGVMNDPRAIAS